jgi:hypothetical protein
MIVERLAGTALLNEPVQTQFIAIFSNANQSLILDRPVDTSFFSKAFLNLSSPITHSLICGDTNVSDVN